MRGWERLIMYVAIYVSGPKVGTGARNDTLALWERD